jgi:ATP-dependent DNA helicase PIF1
MSNMQLIDQQDSQRYALRTIQDLYIMGTPGVIFLDAPAGSGKTFLLQTLLHMVRADAEVALAVSSTGITALHFEGGSTLHSKLKAPLDLTPEARLNINTQSAMASVIRMAKLLIWEESVMHNTYMLSAVDASFRDIRNSPNVSFGGMLIVMAGDLYVLCPASCGCCVSARHC